MKLSIITICYNIKDEIERTCQSIVAQTNQDFEWIVVDGGSTDGTKEILEKYKERINIFISEPDTGIYNAMNKGIKKASGEYLNFMNGGDCFASADVIEKFYNADIQNADVIYGNMNYIKTSNNSKIIEYPESIDDYFFYNNTINHQSSFIKRNLFDEYGLYDENYKIASDWGKFVIFMKKQCKFSYWNFVIANFYEGGISSTAQRRLKEERQEIINIHFTQKEIRKFEKRKVRKYKIYLFNFIPFILVKNIKEGSKIICNLFGIIPLYKIKKKSGKSKHYLFNFIPLFKIKG